MARKQTNPIVRFMERVNVIPGGCWEWTGTIGTGGYGYMWFKGRNATAHRIALALFGEGVPDGMHVHHKCHNRGCVRPDHLEILSPTDHARLELNFAGARAMADKTHCPRGHEYAGRNLYIGNSGSRFCRECAKIHQAEFRARRRLANPGRGRGSQWRDRTHCPRGHEYAGDNLYIRPGGARVCRACKRIRAREGRAAIRGDLTNGSFSTSASLRYSAANDGCE
jgi:CxxC motif-containing protein